MTRSRHPHCTLPELWRAFKNAPGVAEADIRDGTNHVCGLCHETGLIIMNPAPDLVEKLLHELIHATHWRWSEDRVKREADYLIRHMNEDEVRQFYASYQRRVRRLHRIVRLKE